MRLLLDSSVLIDVLRARRGRRELLVELAKDGHILATSALNIAEVYAGMRPEERDRTESFLGALDCYPLTGVSARQAGKMQREWSRRGRTLTLADTIVAAIALEQECTLMTDNRRDFPMTELQYYSLDEK